MTTRKKQTPKTWRRADDLACGEPTEAIIRSPITEPKRLGKDLPVEDKIVGRPAATSQILGVTAVGYNTCPEEPPGCLRAESQGAKQVCNRSRRSHFFSDVEVFVFIASSINLCNSSGVASFVPI